MDDPFDLFPERFGMLSGIRATLPPAVLEQVLQIVKARCPARLDETQRRLASYANWNCHHGFVTIGQRSDSTSVKGRPTWRRGARGRLRIQ
jgi:hypothetical protein